MALWKPFRGNRESLETVEKHDGYVYFCVDDGTLFFDYLDSNGILQRKQINAKEAESIVGIDVNNFMTLNGEQTITGAKTFSKINIMPQEEVIAWPATWDEVCNLTSPLTVRFDTSLTPSSDWGMAFHIFYPEYWIYLDDLIDYSELIFLTHDSATDSNVYTVLWNSNDGWLQDTVVLPQDFTAGWCDYYDANIANSFSTLLAKGEDSNNLTINGSPVATQEWVQNNISSGDSDLNLKNGEGACSLEQTFVENGETKGSKAYGKYATALNQSNEAYQRNAFVTGGGNKVGLTEVEFNAKNPSGKDKWGSEYSKSNSFANAGGQENSVTGRAAHIGGGVKNTVSGDFAGILAGGQNVVSSDYSGIVSGYENEVSGQSSAVLDGYANKITSENSGVGGEHNVIGTTNTHAFGANLESPEGKGVNKLLVGQYNDKNSYALFQVGNGTSEDDRRNAFEVYGNGQVKVYEAPAEQESVLRKVDLFGNNTIAAPHSYA